MTKPKRPRNPDLYKCKNPACARTTPLQVSSYGAYPSSDVEPERVHRVTEAGIAGGFSIQCPACGHYTVVTPWRG